MATVEGVFAVSAEAMSRSFFGCFLGVSRRVFWHLCPGSSDKDPALLVNDTYHGFMLANLPGAIFHSTSLHDSCRLWLFAAC